eukprot:symbB.v1.2.001003.t1/scaffold43.1/size391093/32
MPGVVGGLAICPWLDLTMSGPSYQRNALACFLHHQWLQFARQKFLGVDSLEAAKNYSYTFHLTSSQQQKLRDLPLLVVATELDLLQSDAMAFAQLALVFMMPCCSHSFMISRISEPLKRWQTSFKNACSRSTDIADLLSQRLPATQMTKRMAAPDVALLCSGKPSLTRLKPLLVLASGELRMALEGYGSKEGLVAACMLLEEAIVAFGKEAEILESSGNLEEVSECLREIHRALQDIFDYCADLPITSQAPEELAIVARVVAAFQLEDPRQFTSEFQHAIEAFCQLEPSEFKVLLPCLQELQDWHFTKAFAKVLEVAHWGLECSDSQRMEAWRQCAMMVAEVALDAAVYLPEVSLPPLDDPEVTGHRLAASAEFALSCSLLNGVRLPRPVPAADAKHEGVRRLCKWSRRLWLTGRKLALT